jgi:hypothetical protein
MNHWVQLLRELPALGQRLIANSQRISLPRNADAETRLARLRRALCHAATVRVTYAALNPTEQSALHDLRAKRGGIRLAELEQRYGPIRSWRQLAADRQPRSIAERLLLLGWLLPRPATARHAARYVLAPELRRWLLRPLEVTALGAAPTPPPSPALRAAALILLTCAEQPLPLQHDGSPRIASLRLLAPRQPAAQRSAAAIPALPSICCAQARQAKPRMLSCYNLSSAPGTCGGYSWKACDPPSLPARANV